MSKKDLKISLILPSSGLKYLVCFDDTSKRELDCYLLIKEKPEFKVINDNDVFWNASIDRFQKNILFTEKLSLSIKEIIKYSRVYDIEKENKKIIKLIYSLGKETRKKQKITQKKMADIIGVPQSSIARIEKGEIDVQLSTMLNYLSPLGLTLQIVNKDIPNKTTLKALKEADAMNKDSKKYKRYSSFGEALNEVL